MRWIESAISTFKALWAVGTPVKAIAEATGLTEKQVGNKRYTLGLRPRTTGWGPNYRYQDQAWTEDAVMRLKRMAHEGLPDPAIARNLGVTPSAVIGKRHRLGISAATGETDRRKHGPTRIYGSDHAAPLPPERPAPPLAPGSKPKQLWELGTHDCRWPFGTPGTPEFGFLCENRKLSGLPYCTNHCRIAYRSVAEVKHARASVAPA